MADASLPFGELDAVDPSMVELNLLAVVNTPYELPASARNHPDPV
jgi:hypothetical protein